MPPPSSQKFGSGISKSIPYFLGLISKVHDEGCLSSCEAVLKGISENTEPTLTLVLAARGSVTLIAALSRFPDNIQLDTGILRVLNALCSDPDEQVRDALVFSGSVVEALVAFLQKFQGQRELLMLTCSAIRCLGIHSDHRSAHLVQAGALIALARVATKAHGLSTQIGREEADRALATSARSALSELTVIGFKKKPGWFSSHWLPRNFSIRQDSYTGEFSIAYSVPDSASFSGTMPLTGLISINSCPADVIGTCAVAREYGRYSMDLETEGRTFHLLLRSRESRDALCDVIAECSKIHNGEVQKEGVRSNKDLFKKSDATSSNAPPPSMHLHVANFGEQEDENAPPPECEEEIVEGSATTTSVADIAILAAQAEHAEDLAELAYNAAGEDAERLEREVEQAEEEAQAAAQTPVATTDDALLVSKKREEKRALKRAALAKAKEAEEAAALALFEAQKAERKVLRALRKAELSATAAAVEVAMNESGAAHDGAVESSSSEPMVTAPVNLRESARLNVKEAHIRSVHARGPPPKPKIRVTAKSRAQRLAEEEEGRVARVRALRLGALFITGSRRSARSEMTETEAAVLVQSIWRSKKAASLKKKLESSNVQAKLALFNKVNVVKSGITSAESSKERFFDGPDGKELAQGWQRIDNDAESEGVPYYVNLVTGESMWTPRFRV